MSDDDDFVSTYIGHATCKSGHNHTGVGDTQAKADQAAQQAANACAAQRQN